MLQRGPKVVLDRVTGGYAILKEHKNKKKKGDRRLQIPPDACGIMLDLLQLGNNPFYFPGRVKGRPLTRGGLHKVWMDVREKAGLTGADLVFHDFRSLADSEGEEQGISGAARAAIMGHSEATAQKHYTKARGLAAAAAKIAAPIAAALAGKGKRKKS